MIELVIFDCDGVLVDSEPISHRVLAELARTHGAQLTAAESLELFRGGHLQHVIEHIESLSGRSVPADFLPLFRERCAAEFEAELKPIQGIEDVLAWLQIPCCVASNGPLEKMQHMLTLTDLMRWFESRLFSAYSIESWKPEPDLFLHAAASMGVSANRCCVIEDSRHGIEAAARAGMRAIAYLTSDNEISELPGGVPRIHAMNELPGILSPLIRASHPGENPA